MKRLFFIFHKIIIFLGWLPNWIPGASSFRTATAVEYRCGNVWWTKFGKKAKASDLNSHFLKKKNISEHIRKNCNFKSTKTHFLPF